MKKLLSSDWLTRSSFSVNITQRSVTRVQITMKISKVKTETQRLPKANRFISKTAEDRAKSSEDRTKPYEDHTKISEDRTNTFEDFRRSPDIFEAFSSFGKPKAVPSAYLRGFK